MFSRTRNKRKIKNNKFKILCILVLICLLVLYFLLNFVYKKYKIKTNFENDLSSISSGTENDTFYVKKIVLYSSANATNNETNRDLWNLNIYQFTDIAIYIENNYENELNSSNTIKSLTIDNINYKLPERRNTLFIL